MIRSQTGETRAIDKALISLKVTIRLDPSASLERAKIAIITLPLFRQGRSAYLPSENSATLHPPATSGGLHVKKLDPPPLKMM